MARKVLIIGGGIAGLCAAIALRQAGMDVQVYEKSAVPAPAGAGIIIAPNALKALEPYGIDQEIARQGYANDGFRLLSDRGAEIARLSVPPDYGSQYSIHRQALHRILLAALPPESIAWNKSFAHAESDEEGIRVTFGDGSQDRADLLVAADGIHSAVRRQLFPEYAYRYAGYTCWRGVIAAEGLTELQPHFIETWGARGRFGIVPLPDHQVYWYALVNARQSDPHIAGYSTDDLHARFADYHDPIPKLLRRAKASDMIHRDILDIAPMKRFYTERIVFVGDAAHAITPNMGQGACQAMEDARVLADCLSVQPDIQKAFAAYDAGRRARIEHISSQSWKIGRLAQAENPWFVGMRNRLMKHAPKSLSRRQARSLYDFQLKGGTE